MHLRPVHDRVVVRQEGSPGSRHFAFPQEVVDDPSLSVHEKREILAEWASDRSAVESYPTLRWLSGTTFPVTFSAVAEARRSLDEMTLMGSGDPSLQRERRLVTADFARPGRQIARQ